MARESRPDDEVTGPFTTRRDSEIGDVNTGLGPQRLMGRRSDFPADEGRWTVMKIMGSRKLPPLPYGFRVLPNPQAVSDARRRLAAVVRAWGKLNDEAIRDLELCAAELIANAAQHTAAPCAVYMRWTGTAVRVSVTDTSPEMPRDAPPGHLAEDGRGVTVVAHLATSWAAEPDPAGKVVWFDIAPAGRTSRHRLVALLKATAPRIRVGSFNSPSPAANRAWSANPLMLAS